MTQVERGWGSGPSARYEALAGKFRPIFEKIRATAAQRDISRSLPRAEIGWLKEAGFTRLRLPEPAGGSGLTLPELFALLIELSEADTNVTNALRAHVGFTEDVLTSPFPEWRDYWLARIARGETAGSGFSETGEAKVGSFATTLVPHGDAWLLDGRKFYTTGSLFADWINFAAQDQNDELIAGLVSTTAEGVTIDDDWNGFGQALTASGTAHFNQVPVDTKHVNPSRKRFIYATAFFQLVHLASLAGIGRAAATDVARLVRERKRVFSHGNAAAVSEDPQILQVVGRVRSNAYAAGAIVAKSSEALQRVYDAIAAGDVDAADAAAHIADVEVNQSVTVVTNLVLEATTVLFDALGASASSRSLGLDRYWRNARTISSHNPRVYRERTVGDFGVNGTPPPVAYRVGLG